MAVAGLTAGVCLVSAASSLALLWLAAPLAGFAFGCHWSLMPPLASELFGMRSFASLYCLLQFATTFGTYAFATRLVRAREGTCCLLPLRRSCSPWLRSSAAHADAELAESSVHQFFQRWRLQDSLDSQEHMQSQGANTCAWAQESAALLQLYTGFKAMLFFPAGWRGLPAAWEVAWR